APGRPAIRPGAAGEPFGHRVLRARHARRRRRVQPAHRPFHGPAARPEDHGPHRGQPAARGRPAPVEPGPDRRVGARLGGGGGRVLLPGYTGVLFVYDTGQPWGADNPHRLGSLGNRQHLATAADRDPRGVVAIATPPDYGSRGGALSLFDPATLAWRTFVSLVPDQSMTAVCFGPLGRLYGGS